MELIRPALQADVDCAAARAPELRVIGIRLHAKLLHSIGRWHEGQHSQAAILRGCVGRAVDQELIGTRAAAADRYCVHPAVVERPVRDAAP
jgi:hypothetical protein